MGINQKELQKIVKFCRKNGVSRIKTGEFELELEGRLTPGTSRHRNADPGSDSSPPGSAIPPFDSLTREQQLLWSSTPTNEGFSDADS